MQKVVITKKLPIDISTYLKDFRLDINASGEQLPLLRLRQMVSDAEAIISCSSDVIDKTLIDSSPKLKVIVNYSTGYSNIDVEYARKKGITVCAAGNALTQGVAELIFALTLSAAKFIVKEDKNARNTDTPVTKGEISKPLGFYKKTFGIIGMDNIGQAAAKIATGLSMDIIYHDAKRNYQSELLLGATYASFDEIIEWADFLVISTVFDNFINEKITYARFKRMKRSAMIVSLDISQIVDAKDLVAALKDKLIAAAGLCIGNIPKTEADILKTLENVTLLPANPENSSLSVQAEMAKICAECVINVLTDGVAPDNAITI